MTLSIRWAQKGWAKSGLSASLPRSGMLFTTQRAGGSAICHSQSIRCWVSRERTTCHSLRSKAEWNNPVEVTTPLRQGIPRLSPGLTCR